MNYNEEQIIKFADDALYEVKEIGRNKVSFYKEK
jgi:GGDEF domain-containing protein